MNDNALGQFLRFDMMICHYYVNPFFFDIGDFFHRSDSMIYSDIQTWMVLDNNIIYSL